MTLQTTTLIWLLLLALMIALLVLQHILRSRTSTGRALVILLLAAIMLWAGGYAIQLTLATQNSIQLLGNIIQIGVLSAPVLWTAYVMLYTGYKHWFNLPVIATMSLLPILALALYWTNDAHHLMYKSAMLKTFNSITYLEYDYAIGNWIIAAYSIGIVLFSLVGLAAKFNRDTGILRKQAGILLLGAVPPTLLAMLNVAQVGVFAIIDPTPFALLISALALAWGVFHYDLLDILPVAQTAVMGAIRDGVLIADKQGRLLDINPQACALLAIESDPRGQVVLDVLRAHTDLNGSTSSLCQLDRVSIDTGSEQTIIEVRAAPFSARSGAKLGCVLTLRDISERIRREAERERLIEELQAYAHTVAHDLKNPLSQIIGLAESLNLWGAEIEVQDARKYAAMILDGGLKMNQVIEDLMLLAVIEKDDPVITRQLDMHTIVAESLKRIDDLINQHNAQINLPTDWDNAQGYAPWIEEVWLNYLSNAAKYGGTSPRIDLGSDTLPDGKVRFWIRDHGPGLAPELPTDVFGTRLVGVPPDHNGHGLGLSIVKRIVHRLGGEVGVESEPGAGALFWFTLPVAQVETV